MKTRYLIVIMIAGIIIIVMSAIHFYKRPKTGDAAPPFKLADISGKQISLESHKGKIVFLHFWASWCGTCLSEIPAVERIYKEYEGKDLAVLTILVDDDGRSLSEIKKRTQLNYPVLLDPEGEVADAYQVWGVPETFVIDRNGVILERSASAIRYDEMKQHLDRLLVH